MDIILDTGIERNVSVVIAGFAPWMAEAVFLNIDQTGAAV